MKEDSFGAWFPDFPGCVAAAATRDEAIRRAEIALARAADTLVGGTRICPPATPIEEIVLPKNCNFIAYFIVGVEPPNPSERINIYLPEADRTGGCARHRTGHEPLQLFRPGRQRPV